MSKIVFYIVVPCVIIFKSILITVLYRLLLKIKAKKDFLKITLPLLESFFYLCVLVAIQNFIESINIELFTDSPILEIYGYLGIVLVILSTVVGYYILLIGIKARLIEIWKKKKIEIFGSWNIKKILLGLFIFSLMMISPVYLLINRTINNYISFTFFLKILYLAAVEEIIFRWIMIDLKNLYFKKQDERLSTIYLVITQIIWVLFHFPFYRDNLWTISVYIVFVNLSILSRYKINSLLFLIFCHVVYNYIIYLY